MTKGYIDYRSMPEMTDIRMCAQAQRQKDIRIEIGMGMCRLTKTGRRF